jgi:choline dehydrogenase-like flavoprotein
MLRPFHSIAAGAVLRCDVCIIGTGPAGITLARSLERAGFQIIMIEAGGTQVKSSTQEAYAGELVNAAHPPPQMYRQRRLGGSSAIWGGRCTPLDELDFLKRDHVPFSGWPFPRAAIEKYYRQAQDVVEVGDFDYSAASALDGKFLIAEFDDPHVTTDNLERYSPPTRFWRRYRDALTKSRGVTVVSGATCLRFDSGHDRNEVRAAECVGLDGRPFTISARFFVAAVGGLEVVRLLAFSELGMESDWLGRNYMCHVEATLGRLRLSPRDRRIHYGFEKSRDGVYVKRRFMLAPERQAQLGILNAAVRIHYPSIIDPSHKESVLSALFLARKFVIPEYSRHFSARKMPEPSRKFSLVDSSPAALKTPQNAGFFMEHVRNVAFGLPSLAMFAAHWGKERYFSGRQIPYIALKNKEGCYALNLYGEQAPNRDSRVMLGDKIDQNGVPRLKIDWRAQEIDFSTVWQTVREIKRAMESSGCGTVEIDEEEFDDEVRHRTVPVGGHHIGTARMSDDPRQGVVNAHGLVHGVSNLYVAGSAIFPTSGQANPTLTIVALSLRMAEHLAGCLRPRQDSVENNQAVMLRAKA